MRTLSHLIVLSLMVLLVRASENNNKRKASNRTVRYFQEFTDNRHLLLNPPRFSSNSTKPILLFCMAFFAMTSIASNSLVIHVIRINQHMRSTTNFFIMNMASADLLATLIISSASMKVLYTGWLWSTGRMGVILCKGMTICGTASLMCSVFSLVAITFDRFMAVSRPLTHKYCSWWTKYIIPVIWVASLVVPSLMAVKAQLRDDILPNNKTYCFIDDVVDEGIAALTLGIIVPHVAIGILYSMIAYKLWTRRVPGEQTDARRQNAAQHTAKKVTCMIVCIVLVFDICMAPLFTVLNIPYVSEDELGDYISYTPVLFSIISNFNGFLNTLVYAFFSENYRRAFSDALGLQRMRNWLGRRPSGWQSWLGKRNKTASFTVTHKLANK